MKQVGVMYSQTVKENDIRTVLCYQLSEFVVQKFA